MRISVQREDFDLGAEVKAISGNPGIGAVASFIGLVRDVPMTLEHFPGDRKSTRLNSSHIQKSRMPSSA